MDKLTETRPWGYYTILKEQDNFKSKYIKVEADKKLSYQRHKHRSEHWFIVSGIATVTIDGKVFNMLPGESIDIPVNTLHRIQAGTYGVEFIEVQTGTYFGEDDIERIEDDYGR